MPNTETKKITLPLILEGADCEIQIDELAKEKIMLLDKLEANGISINTYMHTKSHSNIAIEASLGLYFDDPNNLKVGSRKFVAANPNFCAKSTYNHNKQKALFVARCHKANITLFDDIRTSYIKEYIPVFKRCADDTVFAAKMGNIANALNGCTSVKKSTLRELILGEFHEYFTEKQNDADKNSAIAEIKKLLDKLTPAEKQRFISDEFNLISSEKEAADINATKTEADLQADVALGDKEEVSIAKEEQILRKDEDEVPRRVSGSVYTDIKPTPNVTNPAAYGKAS